jgi:2-polyprenyl-6-hydroxyphenyl methylase/3-demethylubiquinone-9 3-methyltransferase
MQHRHAISDWIILNRKKLAFHKIIDYGGGFGTLAKLIAQKDSSIQIDIFEPHPSELAQKTVTGFANIHFVNSLNGIYDCLVSTDVLEHVPDTLKTFSEMINAIRLNGYLIIANNFYPVIKCHLPSTFHFRYSFKIFAKIMGLSILGPCGNSHAIRYKKKTNQLLNWKKIRFYENLSRASFPILKLAHYGYNAIKRTIK